MSVCQNFVLVPSANKELAALMVFSS